MRTVVYVDGFNLYYRALKNTSWKWLDLMTLFRKVLQGHHQIERIKYFTAHVNATQTNPSKSLHQQIYLQALKHHSPEVDVFLGHFLSHVVAAPLAKPEGKQRMVEIVKTEEKGSDVNLAVHLLNDAWLDAYDCAVVVSNDSDLAESMRLVRLHHQKLIGLITPGASHPSRELLRHADFARHIRPGALSQSQLPDPIPGTNFRKPADW